MRDPKQWADANPEDWLQPADDPGWQLRESGYDSTREAGIEARYAIGNGFLGVRGSRAISRGPTWVTYQSNLSWASWPRTYVAGLFDTPNALPPVPALVPAPDWSRARITLNGRVVLLRSGEILGHHRILDLRHGAVVTQWAQRQPTGQVVRAQTLRVTSLADRHLALQVVRFWVDGDVDELRFDAIIEPTGSAMELLHAGRDGGLWRTAESGTCLAIAVAADATLDGGPLPRASGEPLTWRWTMTRRVNPRVEFVRIASFAKAKEPEEAWPRARTALERARASGLEALLARHRQAWADRWRLADVTIAGDPDAERALRFAIYHLTIAANPEDERVSIGARALTGDAYLGHVFWDTEIYLLPFYVFTWPEAARALLMYRWHTLPGARAKARSMGYRGALYAWESADTGEETTPERVIDPTGRVIDVLCGLQEHHISADIAYAVWQYWQATEDEEFLRAAGAEILLETARFWASRASREADGHHHIRGVIGPDEYHETIDDNAYTNVMAAWTIRRGLDVLDLLRARWPEDAERLATALALDRAETQEWREVADGLITGWDPATGMIEQFAGYFALEDIDLGQYTGRSVPMDVVLGRERTQASQVVKQADVVALLALLPDLWDRPAHERNFRYYEPRCGHGSSLSAALHGVVAARLGEVELAERFFRATAAIDLGDPAVGSAGGIHIAAQGGLWQLVVFGFAGLRLAGDRLALDPVLPAGWRSLAFRVQWRRRLLRVAIDGQRGVLAIDLETGEPAALLIGGRPVTVRRGELLELPWSSPAATGTVAAAAS